MKMRIERLMAGVVLVFIGLSGVMAEDAQWRGAKRDGKYADTGLLKAWPEGGPELILQKKGLGNGYSTPIVYKGDVYITGRRDSVDVVTKLDLQGRVLWETVYGEAWNQSFPETRSTPTIADDRLYIMGGLGTIVCMDTGSGSIIWSVNTHEDFQGEFHRWGMAESLLLTENAVISSPVGEQTVMVALDKRDGSLIWKTESIGGVRSYVSPLLIDHNGQEMIIGTSSKDLFAIDPSSGKILWKKDIVTGHSGERNSRNNTNTPLYHEGLLFTTAGYDAEALMFEIADDGKDAILKWGDYTLDTHHGGIVLVDGYIYGANWLNNGNGNWVCQDWETGEVMYEEKWKNKGSIIHADGLLYIYEEKGGNVGLLEPSPEGFNLISTFPIEGGEGPHWAHMSIYEKKLFVRHGTVLFVYDLAQEN